MEMFETLVETLKKNPKKIVFTEGTDARILSAADRLIKAGDFLKPVLVGNVEAVKAAAAEGGFCIDGAEIYDPETYADMEAMAEKMYELRKGKMDMDTVKANLKKGNYFGTMLVKMGVADALATRTSAPASSGSGRRTAWSSASPWATAPSRSPPMRMLWWRPPWRPPRPPLTSASIPRWPC